MTHKKMNVTTSDWRHLKKKIIFFLAMNLMRNLVSRWKLDDCCWGIMIVWLHYDQQKADVFRSKYWEYDISTFVNDPFNTFIMPQQQSSNFHRNV